jgi:hypothetical protein
VDFQAHLGNQASVAQVATLALAGIRGLPESQVTRDFQATPASAGIRVSLGQAVIQGLAGLVGTQVSVGQVDILASVGHRVTQGSVATLDSLE